MNRLIAAFVLIGTSPVFADPAKECILKAASVLPHNFKIVGKASTRPAPKPSQVPNTVVMLVDVNVSAAGQRDRWTFLCMHGAAATLVQRVRE
jgi:hypothetical protein